MDERTDGCEQCGITGETLLKSLPTDAIDDPNVSYSSAVVDADDSGSEQVPVESSDMVAQQHLALVTQEDGTQQQVTDGTDVAERGKRVYGCK